jgi:uncharacterized protein (DUF2236 family)
MLNNVHNALLLWPEARTQRFHGVVRSMNIRIAALSLPLAAPSIIYSIG